MFGVWQALSGGSAGIYNLSNPEISNLLLQEKMECARATGAQAIVTANPGCLLQLRAGVQQFATGQQVLHLVELLDRGYAGNSIKNPEIIAGGSQPY